MSAGRGHMDSGAYHDCLRSAHLKDASMGFVDIGGVRIVLLSGKGQAVLLWAMM